jgi:hypothetical protein
MPFGLKSAESADGALSFSKARKKSSWHGPAIITLIDPPGGRSPALQSDLRKTVSAGDAFLGSEVNAVSMVSFAQTAAKLPFGPVRQRSYPQPTRPRDRKRRLDRNRWHRVLANRDAHSLIPPLRLMN